jgi:hypothetical protein
VILVNLMPFDFAVCAREIGKKKGRIKNNNIIIFN